MTILSDLDHLVSAEASFEVGDKAVRLRIYDVEDFTGTIMMEPVAKFGGMPCHLPVFPGGHPCLSVVDFGGRIIDVTHCEKAGAKHLVRVFQENRTAVLQDIRQSLKRNVQEDRARLRGVEKALSQVEDFLSKEVSR